MEKKAFLARSTRSHGRKGLPAQSVSKAGARRKNHIGGAILGPLTPGTAHKSVRNLFQFVRISKAPGTSQLPVQQKIYFSYGLALGLVKQFSPLGSNCFHLGHSGIMAELLHRPRWRAVFIHNVFMKVTAQKVAKRGEICSRDLDCRCRFVLLRLFTAHQVHSG